MISILLLSMILAYDATLSIFNVSKDDFIITLESEKDIYGSQFYLHYNSDELVMLKETIHSKLDQVKIYHMDYGDSIIQMLILNADGSKILDTSITNNISIIGFKLHPKEGFKGSSIIKLSNISIISELGSNLAVKENNGFFLELSFQEPIITSLAKNYPNPFQTLTNINYALSDTSFVNLVIYDSDGYIIKNLLEDFQTPDYYTITWDGSGDDGGIVPNGSYALKMSTPMFSETIIMTVLR